jgi:cellulose synthase/poly-beta-1,6-N-acetylglucosamine synthase-like glycosyltransferase
MKRHKPSSQIAQPEQSAAMQYYSQLSGELRRFGFDGQKDHVSFVRTDFNDRQLFRFWTRLVAYGSVALVVLLTAFLFQPGHWVALKPGNTNAKIGDWAMLICLAVLQLFLLVGTFMASRSTVRSKNPVPLIAPKGLNVALATTRAPGEPIALVRRTLTAAKKVRYEGGHVDVWLLDETKSLPLQRLCKELGVRYFSRKSVSEWNVPVASRGLFGIRRVKTGDPRFAAGTKHGNFNAWGTSLKGETYDIIAGIDTDQVPEINFLERLLGYFNDKDVAFVVGPQVYANQQSGLKGLVTRWAESQASFFQSTIQRAANSSNSAMFVGTNYAVRSVALSQVGGFFPCITEDLATGLAIHMNRNPKTGNHWKSVYTPDVLAIGEGPEFWSTFFSQQWRWAAGAFDATRQLFKTALRDLPAPARTHYILILTFYPIAALAWLVGLVSSLLYMLFGASAISVSWTQFMSLYLMSVVLQLGAYFWNHRRDVSPFTPPGSFGVPGMVITSLTAPIYLSALFGVVLGRKVTFVVTKKGSQKNPDWFKTFALQMKWGLLLIAALIFGREHGRTNAAMTIWIGFQLSVCLLPYALGIPPAFRQHHLSWRMIWPLRWRWRLRSSNA